MTTIDVKTRVIADNTRIWALHAGRRRRYFDLFRELNIAFLELPGFVGGVEVFDDTQLLRRYVRLSEAVAEYVTTDASKLPTLTPPSRNPLDYKDSPGDVGFNRFVGKVRSLYRQAAVGDLILVPGHGGQYGDILVGEIQSPFASTDRIAINRYADEEVPFRKMRWLPVRVRRRDLSVDLSKRLENSNAIIHLDRKRFGSEIFAFSYANYAETNRSKAELEGPLYDDPFDVFPAASLAKYFVAVFLAIDLGEGAKLAGLSVDDVIREYYRPEITETFALKFSSPGNATLITRRAAIALFVLGGIASLAAGLPLLDSSVNISISNSRAAPGDATTAEANSKFQEFRNFLGAQELDELKKREKEAEDVLGLKIDVEIKDESDKKE